MKNSKCKIHENVQTMRWTQIVKFCAMLSYCQTNEWRSLDESLLQNRIVSQLNQRRQRAFVMFQCISHRARRTTIFVDKIVNKLKSLCKQLGMWLDRIRKLQLQCNRSCKISRTEPSCIAFMWEKRAKIRFHVAVQRVKNFLSPIAFQFIEAVLTLSQRNSKHSNYILTYLWVMNQDLKNINTLNWRTHSWACLVHAESTIDTHK